MKRNLEALLFMIGATFAALAPAYAQYAPVPKAAYIYSGSAWLAATSTYTGSPLSFGPPQLPAIALYCYNTSTSKWVPATSACFGGSGGSGTVTSVALTLPNIFTVSGSPVTTSGTLAATLASQTANYFFAAPNGSNGTPSFRAIVAADIPTLNQSTTGNAATATALASTPTTCAANQFPSGVLASGNATGCTANGDISWGTSGNYLTGGTTTQYVGRSSVESGSQNDSYVAPRAGTIQSCSGITNVTNSGTVYFTATLYKNGSSCSGPTIVFNGTSNTAVSDNTHTCTVAQGDHLSWQFAPTGSPTTQLTTLSCLY